jgi:YbbR domain-containing protein
MNKWIKKDWILRLISVAIAGVLWFSLSDVSIPYLGRESYQTVRNVSIEADYDTNRFELVNITQKVELSLYGNRYMLDRLPSSYRVYVDLTQFEPGTHHQVPVQISGLPQEVKVKLKPETITVTLKEKLQREMPINVFFTGKLPAGYQAGEPILNNEKAFIRGSEARLSQVSSIRAVVPLEGVSSSIKKQVKLQAYDKYGSMSQVDIFPVTVYVEVPIHVSNHKEVPLQVEMQKGPPAGYAIERIDLSIGKVLVYGDKTYLDSLQYYMGPKIDLSHVKEDTKIQGKIVVQGKAVKVEPEEVSIYVKIVPAASKTMEQVPIQITGVSANVKASIIAPISNKLHITLSGAPKLLEKISLADVKGFVDVSNLPVGEHEVVVQFKLPPYIEVMGAKDIKATVQVIR